jgi:hypothetical protein
MASLPHRPRDVIVIAASAGGVTALRSLLTGIEPGFPGSSPSCSIATPTTRTASRRSSPIAAATAACDPDAILRLEEIAEAIARLMRGEALLAS